MGKCFKPIEFEGVRLGVITMDIKAELRLIREQCPNAWKRLKQ